MSTAGTIASRAGPYPDAMTEQPSFVVQDQSETIAFLEKALAPAKRIDTHGAVVFLSGERAYKLKRAVKFPYMDFSTSERRAAMCAAEVEINRQPGTGDLSRRRAPAAGQRRARARRGGRHGGRCG